jgi:hypothetical protein
LEEVDGEDAGTDIFLSSRRSDCVIERRRRPHIKMGVLIGVFIRCGCGFGPERRGGKREKRGSD